MKKLISICLFASLILLMVPLSSYAGTYHGHSGSHRGYVGNHHGYAGNHHGYAGTRTSGAYYGWHGPYRGSYGHYGGWYGGYYRPWWPGFYWGGSIVVGPPYYPYGYYANPPVVVQPPAVTVQPEQNYWYYCQEPQGYYPYVKECPGGWMKVLPQPAPPK
jgi:hypothetical protein